MKLSDVRGKAFAMPLHNPSYPRPPYKFYNREFINIVYRTDIELVRELVPEPLEVIGDTVTYEFIRMPDFDRLRRLYRNGAGDPGALHGAGGTVQEGGYVLDMYLDDDLPIAGGRELWGFPKKLANAEESCMRARCWSARCIMARCSAPLARWATSIARSNSRRS